MMKKSVLRTALLYIGLPLGFLLLDYALDRQADNIVGLQPVHLVITSLLLLSVFFVLNRANEAQQHSSDYLRQARDELETRVQERTQELERSNAQLRIEIAQRQKAEADRSRSEQALRESEEQYRDMFDRFPEPVTVWDQSGVLLLENLISARNLGGSREEFIGRNISEIFGPAGNIYLERIRRVAESGITETQDDMVELGIGRRYFWTSMLPVAGPGGQRAVQVISYDITERKNMEQALRVSEEKFATVFHSSPDAIAVIRLADSVLLDVNQAFSTLFGYDSKDVIGKSWVDLELALPKEVQNQVNETLRQQGRFVGYESEFQTRQGASITTITSLTMIKINGEDCILAVIHDITERKNSEKKLNEAQLELSRGIEERTALQERQRLARDLHDSVSQALYGISLGANTALSMIDTDKDKLLEALNYILALAQAGLTEMRALIFELRPESLEIEGLVNALNKQSAVLRVRHGVEVDLDLGEEPQAPFYVKEALYRIAQEAFQNVIKHARATCLSVDMLTSPTEISLKICDNGVGFDTNGEYPGHLGLQSMRERACNAGGSLSITSELGCGAQIIVSIPLPEKQAGAPEPIAGSAITETYNRVGGIPSDA